MGAIIDKELKKLKPRPNLYKVMDRDRKHAAVMPTGIILFRYRGHHGRRAYGTRVP